MQEITGDEDSTINQAPDSARTGNIDPPEADPESERPVEEGAQEQEPAAPQKADIPEKGDEEGP